MMNVKLEVLPEPVIEDKLRKRARELRLKRIEKKISERKNKKLLFHTFDAYLAEVISIEGDYDKYTSYICKDGNVIKVYSFLNDAQLQKRLPMYKEISISQRKHYFID